MCPPIKQMSAPPHFSLPACRQWVLFMAYYQETKSSLMWMCSGSCMRLLALAGCTQSLVLHPSTIWQTGGSHALHGKPATLLMSHLAQLVKLKKLFCLEHDAGLSACLFAHPAVIVQSVCAGYMQFGQSIDCRSQAGQTLRLCFGKRKRHVVNHPELSRLKGGCYA